MVGYVGCFCFLKVFLFGVCLIFFFCNAFERAVGIFQLSDVLQGYLCRVQEVFI